MTLEESFHIFYNKILTNMENGIYQSNRIPDDCIESMTFKVTFI